MIKKAIKYKDYDGNDVEKEFWFNLDAGEIALLELSKKDGLSEWLKTAQENDDSTVVGPALRRSFLPPWDVARATSSRRTPRRTTIFAGLAHILRSSCGCSPTRLRLLTSSTA